MAVNLSPVGGVAAQFFDNDGNVLSGGKIYTYLAGTSTPSATYTTSAGSIAHANPIILDSSGRVPGGEIWLTVGVTYKFTLKNSSDALIGTYDNIPSQSSTDSSLVTYTPAGTGAVTTTVQAKLRQTVSVKDFGAVGNGSTDDFNAMLAAWNYAYPIGANLYFPAGTYLVSGNRSFPFNQGSGIITSLLDCNNMTIYGDGPSSILKTSSVGGADVLQLNGLKNFHVQNLQIQSVISGSAAGSNGISITGGWDNLTFDNVWMYNLAYVDKTTYVDGGAALTVQPQSAANPSYMGSIKATNIYANGCAVGFGYQPTNDLLSTYPTSIDVNILASNCRQGVTLATGEATAAIPSYVGNNIRVNAQTVNCLNDVIISRIFGAEVNCEIATTKTQAQLLLSYKGTAWTVADGIANVIALTVSYAKNSTIKVIGNKKNCRHKAKIGDGTDPLTGQSNATQYCDIYLDITGVSDGVDVNFATSIYSDGSILYDSNIFCTTSTAITLPIEFYDPARKNVLTIGSDTRLKTVDVTSSMGWTESDGRTIKHNKFIQSGVLSTKQTVGSGAGLLIEQWLDNNGSAVFGFRNDGAFAATYNQNATAVATVKKVLPIYDMAGALVGYVPIYTSFT